MKSAAWVEVRHNLSVLISVDRLALGEAAVVATGLNAAEMAKPATERTGWFLPVKAMARPDCAPLGILERLKGRALV